LSNELLLSKFEKYKNQFINEKKVLNCSNNTIITYLNVLNIFYEFISDYDALESITDINKDILLAFLNKDKKIATSTKSSRLRVMKSFFSFIDDQEQEEGKFALRFKKLTIKQEYKESEALTADEVKRLLALFDKKTNSFNKNRDALLIKLILFTGIRASECLDLRRDDFIPINVSQNGEDIQVYKIRVQGKGNKERYVYITEDKIKREFNYLIEHHYIIDYITITNRYNRMSRVGLYNVISNKMKKARINKNGVHILRHTFARDLVAKNINLQTISELLGHASIVLTAKTYARSDEGSKVRAVL